jgi:uncharacterized protein (TIGR04255 family)
MADAADGRPLPKFERPPVVEVAIGVEFLPLPNLTVVPLVELRHLWQAEYPHVEEQPAIRSLRSATPGFNLEVATGVPPIRLWLLSEDRTELLQLQYDRLILNWRATGDTAYPHYSELEPRFLKNWSLFAKEIDAQSVGELRPIAAEITYVNRFHLGEGESLFDALSIFAVGGPLRLAEPAIQMRIELPMEQIESPSGHQMISAGRFQRDPNQVELTLATHVEILSQREVPIETALRRAHVIALQSFAEVTTPTMHERWGRTQ